MTSTRAELAANNNADWYCMMFELHNLQYSRTDVAFIGIDSPPRYHSWMTTLHPEAQTRQLRLIRENADRPHFGIKDGFDCLDLNAEGFVELFSASWIYADTVPPANTAGWIQIESVNELILWEAAWNDGGNPSDQVQFPHAILNRKDVVIWGRKASDGFDGGVIANVSKDCIGLSNCFGKGSFPAAATLCSTLHNAKLPVVGYESGDELTTALDNGFSASGNLRIWSR